MRLTEVLPQGRKVFELTNINKAVDEDVLRGILKDEKMLVTFYGSRLMTVMTNSFTMNAQYDYLEKHYKVDRKHVTNDNITIWVYSPKDKRIYVTMHYYFKDISDKNDPRYKDMEVSFAVGHHPSSVEVISAERAQQVAKDPDSLHIFKIVSGMEDL